MYLLIFLSALFSSFIWLTASITKPHTQYLERIHFQMYDMSTVKDNFLIKLSIFQIWMFLYIFKRNHVSSSKILRGPRHNHKDFLIKRIKCYTLLRKNIWLMQVEFKEYTLTVKPSDLPGKWFTNGLSYLAILFIVKWIAWKVSWWKTSEVIVCEKE